MASVSRLRAILSSAFSSRGLPNGEQEFFEELMAHKPQLVNLYDVGARNPQEQRELESGKILINGRSVAVNADFAKQVVFISQHLDCSERYVTGLLQDVMAQSPNLTQEQCIEAAIMEYHTRRREIADCLGTILQAAERAETADASPLNHRLDLFVRQQLLQSGRAGAGLSLAMKLFQEIHNVGNALSKAQTARQNARSETVAPSQGQNAGLGADILNARCESMKYERRTLAVALFLLARMGHLSSKEIPKIVDWLSANPRHPMVYYLLSTLLAAFDVVDPNSPGGQARKMLFADGTLVAEMKRKLDVSKAWGEPGLKATVLLQWTLFLTAVRRADPALENTDGFKADELETQIWNAVQGDCFTYLARMLTLFQQSQTTRVLTSYASSVLTITEQDLQTELPVDDFKPVILDSCEMLVRSLITQASSELRKIKQRQEDLLLAGARADRTRMYRSSMPQGASRAAPAEPERPNTPPRNDLAMLFSLIGMLYAMLAPEKALHFWGAGTVLPGQRSSYREYLELNSGKLAAFLQWSIWSTQARDVDMSMALFDMLSGLANGQQCSELAYNYLVRGGGDVVPGASVPSTSTAHYNAAPSVSWSSIFSLLETWAAAGAPPRTNPPPGQVGGGAHQGFGASQNWQVQQPPPRATQQIQLSQQDVLLAQAFLRLLSVVVTNSIPARVNICGHARFRAVPTLVSLVPLGLPLELKGAVFDALAAFCEPGAGAAGVEICKSVWTLMERLEVINVRVPHGAGASLSVGRGVELELDEVEAVYRLYPSTIPFLNLLSTLIHTPKRIPLRERVTDPTPVNTIPDALGASYRTPGVAPFVSFVVDNVFARIPHREYLRPSDRWRMNDLCLCFIERSLASFDLESLVTTIEELQPTKEAVVQLAIHPGFEMMRRLLTATPLQASILSYLVEGLDGFEKGLAQEEPFYRSTIIRVLRIIHRVLEIQDIFLDVFLPLLAELNEPSLTGDVPPGSYFIRFDQALSYTPDYVPALAAYICYPAYSELMLLSIRILTTLSSSAALGQLALLIDRSSESIRILEGYLRALDTYVVEDVEAAESTAEQTTGAGAPDIDESSDLLVQAIRLAILDLFIENTHSDKPFPNIAHFLLFGGASADKQIQDPHALGARRSCVHSILDLVNSGVPRLKGKETRRQQTLGEPLFVTLPAFAERCYHVIFQLCQHPRTSEATMRYLRTREDFFSRHLAAIPFKVPATEQQPFVEIVYGDGSRIVTTVTAMSSFLKLRSWILDLVALDLHVLTNRGHHKSVSELLELMFGNEEDYLEESVENWGTNMLKPFREVGQSHLRMIELVQSLDFDWSDSLVVQPQELEFLGQLNLQSCLRIDESGCEVVDRTALLSLLMLAKRTLHIQGRVATKAQVDQLEAESNYILESCAIENHRRKIRYAAATGYESWRRLLDMALMKCFDRLPFDRRESMLFDLLHVLPNSLRSANVLESTAVLLSETILSTITKLREDRRHQVLLQSASGDVEAGALPAERLNVLLRSILECIVDHSRIELVRGNLYAALVNYLHLILHAEAPEGRDEEGFNILSSTLAFSTSRDEQTFSDSMSLVSGSSQLGRQTGSANFSLILTSLSILKPVMERLIAIVSRDAIDGTEVWKTIAFMLLDSLVRLSRWEKHSCSLAALARQGFLSGFVRGLKESDLLLQAVLKPDPDDLNPLYVYEAKLSLLVRMAQTRQGAERLLEARVLPILADCDYLDARPEADQAFLDRDSFLPSAVQRYHQLFMPALQLVSGMIISLGPKHTTAANHALQFLSSHRDTAVLLLKNEVDELSLSVMEEIRLLVTLCSSVVHLIPRTELLSNSGFGTLHGAISSLAAKSLGDPHWTEVVKPQTDAELADAGAQSPEYAPQSKFRAAVRSKEELLKNAVISYLGTASDFAEADFTLAISPAITMPKHDERPTRFIATVPTIGDAIEAVDAFCRDLAQVLLRIVDLSAELANKDHIRVDNIQDIVQISDSALLENLDMRQRQTLVSRELASWRAGAKRRAQTVLNSLEMLLLLLWRHLAFYLEGRHINNPDLKGSIAHTMRFASSPDVDTLKAEAQRRLAPVLGALQSLDFNEDTLGSEWRSYESYRTIMARRLADAVGLEEEPESSEGPQNGLLTF